MNRIKACWEALTAKTEGMGRASWLQFLKFGLVGVSNTAISYLIEMLCYYVLFRDSPFGGLATLLQRLGIDAFAETLRIAVTNILAFAVSVTNSYFWNSRFVFRSGVRRSLKQHAAGYLKTVACYALTGLLLAPWLKMELSGRGIPYWAASLLSLAVTIPLNFALNKFWAFRDKEGAA